MSPDLLQLIEAELTIVRAKIAALTIQIGRLEGLVATMRAAPPESAAPQPKCEDCGAPRSASSGARCQKCYRASLRKPGKEEPRCTECGKPRSPGSTSRCRECYLASTATRRSVALVPVPPPPEPPAPRETHPILARHAREIDPGAPLDPRRIKPRAPDSEPDFPPEFMEKLRRVAEGASLIEVRPLSTRSEGDGLFGSSLDF